jgi:hypothetical protein
MNSDNGRNVFEAGSMYKNRLLRISSLIPYMFLWHLSPVAVGVGSILPGGGRTVSYGNLQYIGGSETVLVSR